MDAFTQTRDYAARRSATQALKALGVTPAQYDRFIEKKGARWLVDVAAATASLVKGKPGRKVNGAAMVDDPEAPAAPAKRAAKQAKTKVAKTERRTVSSVARALIRAGKTNEQVFKALQQEFKLADEKRSYPAWYRSDLRRRGEAVDA